MVSDEGKARSERNRNGDEGEGTEHTPPFDAIVFDLGGVIIELAGMAWLIGATGNRMTPEEIWTHWLTSEVVRSFESGNMEVDEFASALIAELDMPVSPDVLIAEFSSWPTGVYPGGTDLLQRLMPDYTLACLSNTNALHWPLMIDTYGLGDRFHTHFASHLLGMLKPDEAIFHHVVHHLGFPAERILFLDDNQLNVDGARAAGMTAYRVYGVTGAIELLTELGVLRDDASGDHASERHHAL